MLAVLDKKDFQALECTLAPGEADAVDGEIVDETRVEMCSASPEPACATHGEGFWATLS